MQSKVVGVEAVVVKIKGISPKVVTAVRRGVWRHATEVGNRALEYTPKDLGILRGSKVVTLPEVKGNEIVSEVGFGGAAAPYAVIVHEDMRTKRWTTAGTGPKYLERAHLEEAGKLEERIGEEVAEVVG